MTWLSLFFQISLSCDPECGEMEEFMLPASTVTSITLQVEDMCESGEARLDQIAVIGGFAEAGERHSMHSELAF